jgi:uridine kinase
VPARVIVLAGPSGAGKSRLAERLQRSNGWPVLRLDDFYKDGDDTSLPRIADGPNKGLVDWDDPASWRQEDAVDALLRLCRTGTTDTPDYDIAQSRTVGHRTLTLDGHTTFTAEGIFAEQVVAACADAGVLQAAYCITQHPLVTFGRRLARDLREHRKPPHVLLLRGIALARAQRRIVARAEAAGCTTMTGDAAYAELTGVSGSGRRTTA